MQLVFSWAPKLAKSVRVNIGFPVVRTDGHVITKFSGMGRFTYPWCSAGMRESSASTQFQKRGGLLPPQPTGDGDRSIGHHSQSSCLSVRVSFALFCRNTVRRVAPSCHFGFTRFPQPKLKSTKCGFLKTQTSILRSS